MNLGFEHTGLSSPVGFSKQQTSAIESLAVTLQKLESTTRPVDAAQYRLVVRRLTDALLADPLGRDLSGLLSLYPAAAELYENLHYRRNGLCLHDAIQASVAAGVMQRLIDTVRSES